MAPVIKDGKWGFINSKGETVIDFQFVGAMSSFNKGYALFYSYHQSQVSIPYGATTTAAFVNKKGELINQPLYDDLIYFSKDKAIGVNTHSQGKYLFDLKTGKVIFGLTHELMNQ